MSWDDITDPAIRREFRAWQLRRENLDAALERLLTTRDDALCKIWVAEVQRWAATDGQKDWQARTMALQYVAKTKAEGTFDWARFRCTLVNVQADGLLSLAQLLLQMMDAYKPDPGSYSAYAASAMAAAILVTNIGEVPMYGRFLKGCISLYFPPLLGRLIPPRSPSEVASSRAGAAAAKPPPQPKPGPRSKKAKAKAKAKAKKARARQPAAAAACSSATDFKINAMPRFPAYCQWSNWRFRASQLDRKDVCVSFSDVRHSALPPTQEELSAAVRREAVSVLAVEGAGTTGLDMAFAELRELASKVFLPSKGVRVAAFGSAVTGLATRGSDVDVVLVGHSGEDSKTADEIRSAKESDKRGDGSSPVSLQHTLSRRGHVLGWPEQQAIDCSLGALQVRS